MTEESPFERLKVGKPDPKIVEEQMAIMARESEKMIARLRREQEQFWTCKCPAFCPYHTKIGGSSR